MKKTIFILFAVLLVLLMAGCDLLTPPLDTEDVDLPLFTEDGRPMVHLSIGVGNDPTSRAMTENLAKAGANYFEVAFLDPPPNSTGAIYRATWDYSKKGRIAVPAGDYSGADKAVLFAGRYNDKTLLAVGIITLVVDSNGTTTSITNPGVIFPTTSSVTFSLAPLQNDINTISKGSSSVTSTFKITGPAKAGTLGDHDYRTASLNVLPTLPDTSIPIFAVPPVPYTYTAGGTPTDEESKVLATWTVTCGTDKSTTPGTTPAIYERYAGVVLADNGTVNSTAYYPDLPESTGVKVDVKINAPTGASTPIPSTGTIDLEFNLATTTTTTSNGLSYISIDIPVWAIGNNKTITDPITWHIKGGLNQLILDEGKAKNSLGGAILIGVGPVKGKEFEIIAGW